MTAGTPEEIERLKEIGKIVATVVQEMKQQAKAGMTTLELDQLGGQLLSRYGAVSSPKKRLNFPGYTCISVNQEVAHGIPGARILMPGDVVNIDVCAEKDGYVADTGHSFQLESKREDVTQLCDYTYQTMMKVIAQLRAGVKLNEIGRIMEEEAKRGGYQVIKNLCSHGVGRDIHEEPQIYPIYLKKDKRVLHEGQVITIEPFLSTTADYVVGMPDGWTLMLPDEGYAAQHEHTIIITKDEPIIVTAV